MIEQKNEQLKRKEDQIERLREQMKIQSATDAAEINALREQMSAAGDSVVNKLHTLVNKQEINVEANGGAHTQNALNAHARMI